MYIHAGKGVYLNSKKIVGIFDIETASLSSVTKKMLNTAEANGRLRCLFVDLPKSIIITVENIYLSQSAAKTILERIDASSEVSRSRRAVYDTENT